MRQELEGGSTRRKADLLAEIVQEDVLGSGYNDIQNIAFANIMVAADSSTTLEMCTCSLITLHKST